MPYCTNYDALLKTLCSDAEERGDSAAGASTRRYRAVLPAKKGMAKLEKQAQWFEQEYPSAAGSLREGLEEMFAVNRLGLSPNLTPATPSPSVQASSLA